MNKGRIDDRVRLSTGIVSGLGELSGEIEHYIGNVTEMSIHVTSRGFDD